MELAVPPGDVVSSYTYEYNAVGFMVWRRPLGTTTYSKFGEVPLARVVRVDGSVEINFVRDLVSHYEKPKTFNPAGYEYLVAGVTKGDWKRTTVRNSPLAVQNSPPAVHSEEATGVIGGTSGPWTVGSSATAIPTPARPAILNAIGGDGVVRLFWYPVEGVTGYRVYWKADTSGATMHSADSLGETTAFEVREHLVNDTTYEFWVRAISGSEESELSEPRKATPAVVPRPGKAAGGGSDDDLGAGELAGGERGDRL